MEPSSPSRVLIADDEPVFRRVMMFTLERRGLVVEAVRNGADALLRLRRDSFDFVVTDLQMPGMSGTELLAHIRFTLGLTTLPVVLCTAKGLELDAQQICQQYDVTAVLHKPFSPQHLASLILNPHRIAQGVST